MHALLGLGSVALVIIWTLEFRAGIITPWDLWLLPGMALATLSSLMAMRRWPAREPLLLLVPTLALSLYLLVGLHATIHFMSGDSQRYHLVTALYWLPLGYGLAFVFVGLRWAVLISVSVLLGVFVPLAVAAWQGRLPAWTYADGPLIEVVALANLTYICLLSAVSRLRSSNDAARAHAELLHKLARTDMLTELDNRRAMIEELERLQARARRSGQPFSVGLVDVDFFKAINDDCGHAVGDEVLRQIAQVLRQTTRDVDRLARWGGEEFLFCCPDTGIDGAARLAARIQSTLARTAFVHRRPVTVSIGLSQARTGEVVDDLLARADRSLYAAKACGRNCVQAEVDTAPSDPSGTVRTSAPTTTS